MNGSLQKKIKKVDVEILLDGYENMREIGKGQQSTVYSALEKNSKKQVAIKKVNNQYQKKQREFEIVRHCIEKENENIIKFFRIIQQEMAYFVIMELGLMDLDQILKKYFPQGIPEPLVISILRQITNGLKVLHCNQIIHRDLKPSNILVCLSEEDQKAFLPESQGSKEESLSNALFKIIDFGASKIMEQNPLKMTTTQGTPIYRAPEAFYQHDYGLKADMYSLGVLLYNLATGRYPFEGCNEKQLLEEIKKQNADFSNFSNEQLAKLIQQLLQYDPEKRLSLDELLLHEFFTPDSLQQINKLQLQLSGNIKKSQGNTIEFLQESTTGDGFEISGEQFKSQENMDGLNKCIDLKNKCVIFLNFVHHTQQLYNRFRSLNQVAEIIQKQFTEDLKYFSSWLNNMYIHALKETEEVYKQNPESEITQRLQDTLERDLQVSNIQCGQLNVQINQGHDYNKSEVQPRIKAFYLKVLCEALQLVMDQEENQQEIMVYKCMLYAVNSYALYQEGFQLEKKYDPNLSAFSKSQTITEPDLLLTEITNLMEKHQVSFY